MELKNTVTELEYRLKNALAANNAKSKFFARTSHEMRTLLNAIIGFSNLIIDSGKAHDEIKDRLCMIQNSSTALLGIVNDILDIGKIEAGKLELHPAVYCTSSLIHDIASLSTVYSTAKPVTFSLTVDDTIPEYLFGDSLRVKQIFTNLLANAFSYTHSGTVEWKIHGEQEGSTLWIVSHINDTGIGIRQESIPTLFSDYTQVDENTRCANSGSGLGLSIVKSLVQMMDGTVSVQSEYGKGSLFSVRFRQNLVSMDKADGNRCTKVSKRCALRAEPPNFSQARALVVDDTLTSLDVLEGMLAPYRMQVDCVTSGRKAIEMIKAQNLHYDIVFMDHLMPGIDGIQTLRRIRSEIGTMYAQTVPVVGLSANTISDCEQLFFENGFQAFIQKPLDPAQLDSVLRLWVTGKGFQTSNGFKTGNGFQTSKSFQIEGIDISKGIACFGGSKDLYINVLKSYTVTMRTVLTSMKKNLSLNNLNEYTISVHGVKGISFSIGAMKAGLSAERLERLGRTGDAQTLHIEHQQFERYMENFLNVVSKIIFN